MNATHPLTILQITDLHIMAESGALMSGVDTEQSFCQTLAYALSQHKAIDLILVTGDLAQTPCQFSYQRIFKELKKYNIRTLCLPGNHDDLVLMQRTINSQTINCDKQIQIKDWQIINLNSQKLDSPGGLLVSGEIDLLKKYLDKQPQLNTLIAVHHNPVHTDSAWLDVMTIENKEQLFETLKDYLHVKAIICGHIHQEIELKIDDLLILGCPSTCFQFTPLSKDYATNNQQPGYRLLQLNSTGTINSKVYRLP